MSTEIPRDRLANEIEVSEEMARAGLDELSSWGDGTERVYQIRSEAMKAAYIAMVQAATHQGPDASPATAVAPCAERACD